MIDITRGLEIVVKSNVCITPTQCYAVDTYLPAWITAILAGCAYLLIKDILK